MVVPQTCCEGLFDYTGYPSLAESLVRAQAVGAIASFSPTGLGRPSKQVGLNRAFFDAALSDGVHGTGPATTLAKLALYASVGLSSLIDTYLLLGDPALSLAGLPGGVSADSVVAAGGRGVDTIQWQTGGEAYVVEFNIYRGQEGVLDRVQISGSPIPCQAADPGLGATYAYTDTGLMGGETYLYWVGEVEQGGATSYHGPVSAQSKPWLVYLPLVGRRRLPRVCHLAPGARVAAFGLTLPFLPGCITLW